MDYLNSSDTLRLVWPQWQGAGAQSVTAVYPDLPLAEARRSYQWGTKILEALVPEHAGPTAYVDMTTGNADEGSINGIESRSAVRAGLSQALHVLDFHDFARVLTLGGECSVSVAPFAHVAKPYGEELAVVWIDSHPDSDTPKTDYDGWHAMAVSALLGHGDEELIGMLPATVPAERLVFAGVHDGEPDALENIERWGLTALSPDDLRTSSDSLLAWLRSTGATKVAIHFDVDTIDSEEVGLGLGLVPGVLRTPEVARLLRDIRAEFDVVGLTIAEFIPRNVIALNRIFDF